MQTQAHQRMVAARAKLLLDSPLWGYLSLKLQLREDPSCESVWTDGTYVGFNPEYIIGLPNLTTVTALFAHEVGHCVLQHPYRRMGRTLAEWNEACDRALNPELRKSGFHLPDDALFELDPEHLGKPAEWVYNRLPKAQPDGGGTDPQMGQGSEEGEPGEDTSEPSDGAGKPGDNTKEPGEPGDNTSNDTNDGQGEGDPEDGVAQDDTPQPFGGEVRDAGSTMPDPEEADDSPPLTAQDWQQAMREAVNAAQMQGRGLGGAERVVEAATAPYVDWRAVTRRFALEQGEEDYSWAYPDNRFLAHGVYIPSMSAPEVGPFVVAIDTSGSIDRALLNMFVEEGREMFAELSPRRVHVIYCDRQVHGIDTFERGEEIIVNPRGGGGTAFAPVFKAIEELDEPPVGIMYLTDLRGSFPTEDPGIPTLWITPAAYEHDPVPFGEVVAVNE